MEVELKFLTRRAVRTTVSAISFVCILGLLGCGSSIEQVSGSSYAGPVYTEPESEGESASPPGGGLNTGVSHLLTEGNLDISNVTPRGPYNGPAAALNEAPILVRGILTRDNPKNNVLTLSISHRYGDQSDFLQLSVSAGTRNVTDGTFLQHGTGSGRRADAQFASGLAVNPDKTWVSDNLDGVGSIKISDFQLSPTGGSATIQYGFVGLVNPNEKDPDIFPNNIASGTVDVSGRVHVVFGPEWSQ